MYDPDSEHLDPANDPTLEDVILAIKEYDWWKSSGEEDAIEAVRKLCDLGMEPLEAAEFAANLIGVGAAEYGN